ncbi:hypothetical protein RCOM_0922770 [Ricinus communis]|uniref:Uncharacterized protein n=1 Tax=Ricinus communis TaxID=3988 RepID=B9RP03_RICCO|nr:hypothetical protein RCOM_0922770 [Ricinus communis]
MDSRLVLGETIEECARIRLNRWPQTAVAVSSALSALIDPRIGETTGKPAFEGILFWTPDNRPPVCFMDTDDLAYGAMRAHEVHDFWHTIFDPPTNLIVLFPKAVLAGMHCADLLCIYYGTHFHEDFDDVPRKWGMTPAPASSVPKQNAASLAIIVDIL